MKKENTERKKEMAKAWYRLNNDPNSFGLKKNIFVKI